MAASSLQAERTRSPQRRSVRPPDDEYQTNHLLTRARKHLPDEWRRADLKQLIGIGDTLQADRCILRWKKAGCIEPVPGRSYVYRFTSSRATTARSASSEDSAPGKRVPALLRLVWSVLSLPRSRFIIVIAAAMLVTLIALLVFNGRGTATSATDTLRTNATLLEPAADDRLLLHHPVTAWYAPTTDEEPYGEIAAGTPYEPVAHYGERWVQVQFENHGPLWVYLGDLAGVPLTTLPDLMPTPTPVPVVEYAVHTVTAGEELQQIAHMGGSDVAAIRSYNRLDGTPPPGRPLIVPRLAGRESDLSRVPLLVEHGQTDQPWVALTLDLESGDLPIKQMLETLRAYDTQITFFVLGSWVAQHPDIAREIAADGHEFGNHALTHADFRKLTDEEIAHELAETERLVSAITGATTRPFFRFPYGSYDDQTVMTVIQQGYLPIDWNIDPRDSVDSHVSSEVFMERVIGDRSPRELHGAIILSHCCSHETVVEALPALLERLDEMGLEVRPLSDVLGT